MIKKLVSHLGAYKAASIKTPLFAALEAIMECKRPTVLLITGKGNETRQKYGTIYADCRTDVEYVKEYLEEYNHSPSHVLENQNLD